MKFIKRFIGYIVISFVIAYFIGGLLIYLNQHKEVYYPDESDFYSCDGFEDIEKIEHKGTRMYYKENSDKLVIYYHSNSGSACDDAFLKDVFKDYSYIFVEYRGYANDDRRPSKNLILKDVENVNDFIKTIDYSKLVIGGYSLGTGPASYHTMLAEVDSIFLLAPYKSVADLAKRRAKFYPISIILTENYDNELYLKDYKGELMIIHGTEDVRIPIEFGMQLFDSVHSENKEFVEVKAGHGDVFDNKEVLDKIKGFI